MLGAARQGGHLSEVNLASRPFATPARCGGWRWRCGCSARRWRRCGTLYGARSSASKGAARRSPPSNVRSPPSGAGWRREVALTARPAAAERRGGVPRTPACAERTLPVERCAFEHLAQVLPRKVRRGSLSPQAGDPRGDRWSGGRRGSLRSRRPASVASSGRVYLPDGRRRRRRQGAPDLLDRLFASTGFSVLAPAERRDNGQIGFSLGCRTHRRGEQRAPGAGAARAHDQDHRDGAAAAFQRPPSGGTSREPRRRGGVGGSGAGSGCRRRS